MGGFALSNYDLRHLRTFLIIVEQGGISAAAYALDSSLSKVSRDLSALERRFGVQLCQRGRSGFSLTPQGEDIHSGAVKLFSEIQFFEQKIQGARQTLGGGFDLGVIDNVVTNPASGIVTALTKMHRLFPNMLINVSVHSDPMIDIQVSERRVDVGITGQPEYLSPLRYEKAFAEEHRLYLSHSSPHLKTARAIFSGEEATETPLPYVARDYRTDVFQAFEREYPLKTVARGSTLESILAAVLSGVGSALLPVHFVKATGSDELVEVETLNTPLMVQFYFAYRHDAANRRAIRALLDCF